VVEFDFWKRLPRRRAKCSKAAL